VVQAQVLTPRFEDAFVYAARLHATQTRKGSGIPYVSHLMSVCALVLEFGGGEDEAIAALLHDAVEDQGGDATRSEILERFGGHVTEIVDGCTDTDQEPKPPWRPRKEVFLEDLRRAKPEVRLVVACDKLHNARTMVRDYGMCGETMWSRFTGRRDGTLWYYRALVDALGREPIAVLVDELDRAVTELETLSRAATRGRREDVA
jgi:(p)ppGpp synthase/HD superfamily hydrolase